MNIVDIVILTVFSIFAYKNYKKGFTDVIFSLLAVLVGLVSAFKLYPFASPHLDSFIQSKPVSDVLSFILIFIFLNFVVHRFGEFVKAMLDKLYLGWINGLLGLGVGLIKGFVLVGTLVFVLNLLKYPVAKKQFDESLMNPYVLKSVQKIFLLADETIPDDMKQKGKNFFQDLTKSSKK